MLYRIEKYKKEHLEKFDVRDEIKPEVEYLKRIDSIQNIWEFKLPMFTLFADDRPIMIYTITNCLAGTYMPMVYAAKQVDKHTFRMIRCLYDYVDKFVGDDVRRFEAYVGAHDLKTQHLAKFFGFEVIGYRRQAGVDGGDQIIYERLWRK